MQPSGWVDELLKLESILLCQWKFQQLGPSHLLRSCIKSHQVYWDSLVPIDTSSPASLLGLGIQVIFNTHDYRIICFIILEKQGRSDGRLASWKFVPQTHGRRRNLRPKLIQKIFSPRDQASGCRWYGCTTPMKTHKSFQSIGKRGRSDGRLTSWKFVPQTHRQRRNLRPDWNQKTFSQRDQASR